MSSRSCRSSHPKIRLNPEVRSLMGEIKGVLSWFNLLYLDEPYEPWQLYWHALTSGLDSKTLQELSRRLQLSESEDQSLVRSRIGLSELLEQVDQLGEEENHSLYTLLSQYGTEMLLYAMAKTKSNKVKRGISSYFTRLRGTRCFLKGRDLIEMGVKPGPVYKEIFKDLLKARLDGLLTTREDEMRYVRERFGTHLSG